MAKERRKSKMIKRRRKTRVMTSRVFKTEKRDFVMTEKERKKRRKKGKEKKKEQEDEEEKENKEKAEHVGSTTQNTKICGE